MKKHTLVPAILCGVIVSLAPALRAQDAPATSGSAAAPAAGGGARGGRAPMSVDDRLAALTKDLTLTAEQQAKIKPILQDQADKIKALMADTTVAQADRRTKMKAIRDAANTAIKAVLTPEQSTKFDTLQAQRGGGAGGGRRGGGGGNAGGGQ